MKVAMQDLTRPGPLARRIVLFYRTLRDVPGAPPQLHENAQAPPQLTKPQGNAPAQATSPRRAGPFRVGVPSRSRRGSPSS